jgi:hypothetical protein
MLNGVLFRMNYQEVCREILVLGVCFKRRTKLIWVRIGQTKRLFQIKFKHNSKFSVKTGFS